MPRRHSLNRSAANMARTHRSGLETLYQELPQTFKLSDATAVIEDWNQGTFLKLKQAGLLDNEYAGGSEPKDWYLTQQTRRWLDHEAH